MKAGQPRCRMPVGGGGGPPYPHTLLLQQKACVRWPGRRASSCPLPPPSPGSGSGRQGGEWEGGHGIIAESPTTDEGTNPLDRAAVGGWRGHGERLRGGGRGTATVPGSDGSWDPEIGGKIKTFQHFSGLRSGPKGSGGPPPFWITPSTSKRSPDGSSGG